MFQGVKRCTPSGRSCIEKHASQDFNCSVACEGIFVDIQWEEEDKLISEMRSANYVEEAKGKMEKKGELLNKRKFAKLINDYVAFKKKYVRHFRYSAEAKSTNYGKFNVSLSLINHNPDQGLRCRMTT